MDYRCRECDERVDTGTVICNCGNVFPEAVPADTGEPGVTKWPPPALPVGIHQNIATVATTWEQINDATKAVIAVAVVVLLIAIAVVINHHK